MLTHCHFVNAYLHQYTSQDFHVSALNLQIFGQETHIIRTFDFYTRRRRWMLFTPHATGTAFSSVTQVVGRHQGLGFLEIPWQSSSIYVVHPILPRHSFSISPVCGPKHPSGWRFQ